MHAAVRTVIPSRGIRYLPLRRRGASGLGIGVAPVALLHEPHSFEMHVGVGMPHVLPERERPRP